MNDVVTTVWPHEVGEFCDEDALMSSDTLRGLKGDKTLRRIAMLLIQGGLALGATGLKVEITRAAERGQQQAASNPFPPEPIEGDAGTERDTGLNPPPRYIASGERTSLAFQILSEAIKRYQGPDGYEGDLVDAAWQLEQIGRDAWPALTELAFSRLPEGEFFLAAMVRIEGVSQEDRRSVLLAAAKNPDVNVRSRLLELVDELPAELKSVIVGALAAHGQPDDAVTDWAREALTVLEPQGR